MRLAPEQLTALQELARAGGLAAADALRLLLGGRPADLTHTGAAMLPDLVSRLGGPAAEATAIAFRVDGGLQGSMLTVLPGGSPAELARILLGRDVAAELPPPARSALEEAGNILVSSYLTEIGRVARLDLVPSVPHLIRGRIDSILDLALEVIGAGADGVVGLEVGLAAPPDGPRVLLGHFVGVEDDGLQRLLAPPRQGA